MHWYASNCTSCDLDLHIWMMGRMPPSSTIWLRTRSLSFARRARLTAAFFWLRMRPERPRAIAFSTSPASTGFFTSSFSSRPTACAAFITAPPIVHRFSGLVLFRRLPGPTVLNAVHSSKSLEKQHNFNAVSLLHFTSFQREQTVFFPSKTVSLLRPPPHQFSRYD